jgi:hypothetical protein
MTKALITFAENMHEVAILTFTRMQQYAELHNYDFHCIHRYNTLPASWQKVYAFMEYLQTYDVVLWLDADALIRRIEYDISNVFDHTVGFQALAVEPNNKPNCGVWLMRRNLQSLSFASSLMSISEYYLKPCWEQDAVHNLLGYIQPTTNFFCANTILLSEKWNNIHGNVSGDEEIVFHPAGRSVEEKIKLIKNKL